MNLFEANTFQSFWGISKTAALPEEYVRQKAIRLLPNDAWLKHADWQSIMELVLGEGQFGAEHFSLGGLRRLYYDIRPALRPWARPLLHKITSERLRKEALLRWPIEDRYVAFQYQLIRARMAMDDETTLRHIHFWPNAKRFAFVLTHDVEAAQGQRFVLKLAELEKKHGFRSCFNFVPEEYEIDRELLEELMQRGFEVGVHGLKHDGRLFSSRLEFDRQALKINEYARLWTAVGFRSPFTHRNPEWMQALEIEYDSSFFDTDPYEPIPGGTMSIWPFQVGHFIELPYTLAQDHTLMNTLGETTPRLWLEKVAFVRKYCGMALVNTHPDYLRKPAYLAVYEAFLSEMRKMEDSWHALPRDVARWWRKRAELDFDDIDEDLQMKLPGATIGTVDLPKNGKMLGI